MTGGHNLVILPVRVINNVTFVRTDNFGILSAFINGQSRI